MQEEAARGRRRYFSVSVPYPQSHSIPCPLAPQFLRTVLLRAGCIRKWYSRTRFLDAPRKVTLTASRQAFPVRVMYRSFGPKGTSNTGHTW